MKQYLSFGKTPQVPTKKQWVCFPSHPKTLKTVPCDNLSPSELMISKCLPYHSVFLASPSYHFLSLTLPADGLKIQSALAGRSDLATCSLSTNTEDANQGVLENGTVTA